MESSQIIDLTTVIQTKYVQGVVQNLEMTPRINSFDDDYRPSCVRIESQNSQFMEIDQAGQKYQNHQLTLLGRSHTNLAPLDHESKGTSSMEVDEDYGREIIPVPPSQVTT